MEEKKKHKVMIGIEVVLFCMLVAILGTNAASSNPPSNGVSYGGNNQTTVEGALNDLYNKANYGNASAGDILSGKTALVGGKKITGTIPNRMFTGNVTGGLNATYPNIALNVGGNTQLTTGTNGVEYIATSPPQGWYEGGGSSYTVIPKSTVISLYGITANKILKGQSIAGINGTAETTCPSCLNTSDATATERDISNGKTAYVNGQKITGTGIKGKTYEFDHVRATVSGQTFKSGTWTKVVPTGGTYTDFSIDLGFKPTKVYSCHVNLYGNYGSTNQNRWDADFRFSSKAGNWYTMNIPNDYYVSNTDSVDNYTDTIASCVVDGSTLKFRMKIQYNGTTSRACAVDTRADTFFLSGVIAYD